MKRVRKSLMVIVLAGVVCLVLSTALLLPACAEDDDSNPQPSGLQTAVGKKVQAQIPKLVQANNEFATDLYAQLAAEKEGNLFFSPNSIHTALAMTYAGARSKTAEQMAGTLHYNQVEPALFHPTYRELISRITPPKDKAAYELHTANALWLQKGELFLDSFLDINKTNYQAGLFEVDYVGETEGSRKTINKWVEDQTKDKIKELIKPGVLNPLTVLVLTNAIYFKGDWASEFDEKLTREEAFRITADQTVRVPMMNRTTGFGYFESEDLQVLQLPYVGEELSMVVLLPKQLGGLAGLEKRLTAKNLQTWLAKMGRAKVKVSLPKFKTTSQLELNKTLQKMGMTDAFADSADFSGINGRKDLLISKLVHKAYVDVNEQGTEAAAATGVVIGITSVPRPPKVFRADHPFVFMIRHDKTGAILFLGRVVNPTK